MPESRARVLVVEDEYLIRILVEDMLADLGYDVAGGGGPVALRGGCVLAAPGHAVVAGGGTFAEASAQAAKGKFDAAILDINLDGRDTYPVADILAKRGLPFVFVTGSGERSLAPPYRDHLVLPKPFQAGQLKDALSTLLA